MSTLNSPKIFITHSWHDIAFARRLFNDLQAQGFALWFDDKTMQAGHRVAEEINRGLEWCDVYIPVISEKALASKWCWEEINAAIALSNKSGHSNRPRIIPVVAEECEIPALLASRLYINFTNRYDAALGELLQKGLGRRPRRLGPLNGVITPQGITVPSCARRAILPLTIGAAICILVAVFIAVIMALPRILDILLPPASTPLALLVSAPTTIVPPTLISATPVPTTPTPPQAANKPTATNSPPATKTPTPSNTPTPSRTATPSRTPTPSKTPTSVKLPSSCSNPLKLYWENIRGDNFTTATSDGEKDALAVGYRLVRIEGYVFQNQEPGTVPLKLYWHSGRGDNFTTATSDGEKDALAVGYRLVRIEGYVFQNQEPGTVPLKLYWHGGRGDNFTTATSDGEKDALAVGYTFIRNEGYICPK